MYIRQNQSPTYILELNNDEYKTLKLIIDKLIFNPSNVSNYFKIKEEEVQTINQIRTSLNGYKEGK